MRRGALARARGAFFPRSGAGEASVYLACWRGGGPKRPALRWCSGWGRTQALAQAAAARVGLALPAKSLPLGATDATAFTQAGFHATTLQVSPARTFGPSSSRPPA